MEIIEKPKNKKTLTKVKEQWFQDGLLFRQIIDYNKVTGGSMWTKEQKEYLDGMESRLNNKIEANAQGILGNRKAIEANAQGILGNRKAIGDVKEDVKNLQNSVDQILNILQK